MAVKLPIFMDYHATTPVDPRVVQAMLPFFTEKFGNAASRNHAFGWEAEEAVQKARKRVAGLIGADAREIVFTSGATESDNLAIKGVAERYRDKGDHIVTCVIEHRAVLDTCRHLERSGCAVTYLPVDANGLVRLTDLENAITDKTILISIMTANNEVGVVQPIAEIGAIARKRGILFHTDAAQALGKIPFNVDDARVDLASMSAHKMYGPKGIGALYVRRRNPQVELTPGIDGGGHERGMRSGTLNVPAIVGFGEAAELCVQEMAAESGRLGRLRDRLRRGLHEGLEEISINGSTERRLPHNLNVSFALVDGESLLMSLGDVAVSSGSACTSATVQPSYVLKALGVADDLARASIRFGLGRWTSEEEVDYVATRVIAVVKRLRGVSPLDELGSDGVDWPSTT
jgi:cysteine desulfurase